MSASSSYIIRDASFIQNLFTDETAIEDEERLKSVARNHLFELAICGINLVLGQIGAPPSGGFWLFNPWAEIQPQIRIFFLHFFNFSDRTPPPRGDHFSAQGSKTKNPLGGGTLISLRSRMIPHMTSLNKPFGLYESVYGFESLLIFNYCLVCSWLTSQAWQAGLVWLVRPYF